MGLGLKPKTQGYYILIAAGIGILPFIDLFTYLLQKTLHDLIKLKSTDMMMRRMNEDETNFDQLSDLKILLVGSFTSSKQFYLDTPIKELYYLNLRHELTMNESI